MARSERKPERVLDGRVGEAHATSLVGAEESAPSLFLLGVVDHPAFHAAGDGHDLAGDMTRKNG